MFRKELHIDPDTGAEIRMVRYPAGFVNPNHTHPCGHGLFVLEGTLVTHKGSFGPGTFVWFPEGEAMEHGATAEDGCHRALHHQQALPHRLHRLRGSSPRAEATRARGPNP